MTGLTQKAQKYVNPRGKILTTLPCRLVPCWNSCWVTTCLWLKAGQSLKNGIWNVKNFVYQKKDYFKEIIKAIVALAFSMFQALSDNTLSNPGHSLWARYCYPRIGDRRSRSGALSSATGRRGGSAPAGSVWHRSWSLTLCALDVKRASHANQSAWGWVS